MIQQQNPQHEYASYQWVARDVAARLAKRFDRSYEELLDVAEFALVVELYQRQQFKSGKGTKLSSWLWRVVYYYLLEVVVRGKHPRQNDLAERNRREILECDRTQSRAAVDVQTDGMGTDAATSYSRLMEDSTGEGPADRHHWLDNLLRELSEEGRVLVQTIVEAPEEIAHEFMPHRGRPSTKRQMMAVRSYLVDRLDWDWRTFHRAYREVEACL